MIDFESADVVLFDALKDQKYTMVRIAIPEANTKFIGWMKKESSGGTDKPIWFIVKVFKIGNETVVQRASAEFDRIWDLRTTYFTVPAFTNIFSLAFDGVNDYVNIPDDADFDFDNADPFSISLWFKSTSDLTQILFSKNEIISVVAVMGYTFFMFNGYLFQFLQSSFAPLEQIQLRTNLPFNDGQWHNVVFTVDGSAAAAGSLIYVDGRLQPTTLISDSLSGTILNSGDPKIGGWELLSSFADAGIEELSVWNRVLTLGEAVEIYNVGVPDDLANHSAVADLLAWWRMGDSDTFPTILDNHASHDGTMINMVADSIQEDVP